MKAFRPALLSFSLALCFVMGCRKPTASDVAGVYASPGELGSEVVLSLKANGNFQRVQTYGDGRALRHLGTWSFDPTQSVVVLDQDPQNFAYAFDDQIRQPSLVQTNLPDVPSLMTTAIIGTNIHATKAVNAVFRRRLYD